MPNNHLIGAEQLGADQLAAATPGLLRDLLATFTHSLMDAEADAVCGAGYRQRSEGRAKAGNGVRTLTPLVSAMS